MWGAQRAAVCSDGSELYIHISQWRAQSQQAGNNTQQSLRFIRPTPAQQCVNVPCALSAVSTISCFQSQEGNLLRIISLHCSLSEYSENSESCFWASINLQKLLQKYINWWREYEDHWGQHRKDINLSISSGLRYLQSSQLFESTWYLIVYTVV